MFTIENSNGKDASEVYAYKLNFNITNETVIFAEVKNRTLMYQGGLMYGLRLIQLGVKFILLIVHIKRLF